MLVKTICTCSISSVRYEDAVVIVSMLQCYIIVLHLRGWIYPLVEWHFMRSVPRLRLHRTHNCGWVADLQGAASGHKNFEENLNEF